MPNTLGLYDPLFYAQEALIQLEKALGMAARVHRGYEKTAQEKGSIIQIRRPGVFTAQAMPITAGNTSDITPSSVSITLDQWYGVQFGLTDKELAYTQDQIIQEHIRPSAYAVADNVDLALTPLAQKVGWTTAATGAVADFTNAREVLFNNSCPLNDLHFMINGSQENKYLQLAAFHEADKSNMGGETMLRGTLGNKFGFEVFANQNVVTQGGTALASVTQLQANAAATAGDTQVSIKDSDGVLAGTLSKGTTLQFAGHTGAYAVTADNTAAANVFTNVQIFPALKAGVSDSENITYDQAVNKALNLGFHRAAFALAMAPLPRIGDQLGASIATIADPITNLAIRSRMFYDGLAAKVYVSLDVLYGFTVLDSDMAVRSQS